MMPTIFVTSDAQKTVEKLQEKLTSEGVKPINIHVFETEGSIGIAEVKALQIESYIASTGGEKIIIIPHAEELTLPAQNALLKLLEEPPETLSLYLVTPQKDIFLLTILSRCQVIHEVGVRQEISQELSEDVTEFLSQIASTATGDKLFWAQKISKDKNYMIQFIDEVIRRLHKKLIASSSGDNALLLDALINLKTTVSTTNVNGRLAAEETLFNLT